MNAEPTLPPGFSLVRLDDTDSTNEEAKRLIAQGAGAPGTVVWARSQSKGRGRDNRRWTSESGNLFCTTILAGTGDLSRAAELAFVLSLAARETAAELTGAEARCKWPNDILLGGRKAAGILLEAVRDSVIAGCGINVAHFPDDTEFPATCLADAGGRARVEETLELYVARLSRWETRWRVEGFTPVAAEWRKWGHRRGEVLRVRTPAGTVEGTFLRLEDDGALLLGLADGTRRFAAGDVYFPASVKAT